MATNRNKEVTYLQKNEVWAMKYRPEQRYSSKYIKIPVEKTKL